MSLASSCLTATELTAAYGDPEYQAWMLDEKTSIEHIKHAYARGINTFDTANV